MTLDRGHSASPGEPVKAATWEEVEGSPLPLGATRIEEEQAFNFAVCAEHAQSVTLLLYTPSELGDCGLPPPFRLLVVHDFNPQKVVLDPYAKAVFFPLESDRMLAMREGSNAGRRNRH